MFNKIKLFDAQLYRELPLLLLLLLLIVLRIPNLFEPYWYGDEGIYLTIGVALRQGALLYQDIIDHKTPIIYYLSLVPSQAWFRVLLIVWMFITTIGFYHIALKIFKSLRATFLSTLLFVIFTSFPWLEGNIPNGELFVMGFIIWGGLLLLYTRYFGSFFDVKVSAKAFDNSTFTHPIQEIVAKLLYHARDRFLYIISGGLFGLGILTKVPALFDVAAFFSIGWFLLLYQLDFKKLSSKKNLPVFTHFLIACLKLGLVVLAVILLSILYFVVKGSGQAYLDYGLLYNFKYVQSWGLPFTNPQLVWLFSLPGKATILGLALIGVSAVAKKLNPSFLFIASWTLLALFATLLSNRPYPHYFLQAVPPFSLLMGLTFLRIFPKYNHLNKSWAAFENIFLVASFSLFISILLLLNVRPYPTLSYYQRFSDYMTGKINRETYYRSFNSAMKDNYQAAKIISQDNGDHLFIWGTNPMLYALTQKSPPGRFTVSFHIKDFNAYDETFAAVKAAQPHFIVVMDNETTPLPGLSAYLEEHYLPHANFTQFTLWKKHDRMITTGVK